MDSPTTKELIETLGRYIQLMKPYQARRPSGQLLLAAYDHLRDQAAEIERLKRGDFTEPEFQNLCHNLDTNDRCRFEQGCIEYQNKLFGPKIEAYGVS